MQKSYLCPGKIAFVILIANDGFHPCNRYNNGDNNREVDSSILYP
jgi:hypothetical protein